MSKMISEGFVKEIIKITKNVQIFIWPTKLYNFKYDMILFCTIIPDYSLE